jgi:TonB-dependent starch-binding outer membrane protein SusC
MQHLYTRKKILQVLRTGMILMFFAGFASWSHAQVRTITGTVTASDTKETLPGASISLKGTSLGVVTDIDGKYTIKLTQANAVLVFSYIGYTTQEVEVGEKQVVDVVLAI